MSASMTDALTSVGIGAGSDWNPSRVPTSVIDTLGRMESEASAFMVGPSTRHSGDTTSAKPLDGLAIVAKFGQQRVGIRAEIRRAAMNPARIVGELDREAEDVERAVARMLDREPHLLVADLRIVEDLPQRHDAAARHAGGIQNLEPVRDRMPARHFVDERID